MNKISNITLALTCGEPAGIGADICLDLEADKLPCNIVILADKNLLKERAEMLNKPFRLPEYNAQNPQKLSVLHCPLNAPCTAGVLNPANAEYVIRLLDIAYQGIQDKRFHAMVTAPLHKGIINEGFRQPEPFSGHTEYLAKISNTRQVVMMLAGGGLRIALATTHLPLQEVSSKLNPSLLESVIRITLNDLQHKFGIQNPHLLICGLNPHAGENGHLGQEEIEWINPLIKDLQNKGLNISGTYPADTVFQPFILEKGDAVLTMYHDQGLPVLKYASFGGGVNITLGLPFIRTSVDHGTALDLAGTGKAHSGSLKAAIQTAYEMCQAQGSLKK